MNDERQISYPDGKRLAVSVQFPVEWWLEPDSDAQARYFQEYGAKTGAWRLLDMFDRAGVKGTCHMNGAIGALFPDLAREIVKRGHDVAGHGYDQSHPQYAMAAGEERAAVRKTLDAIEDASGLRPTGWVSTGRRMSENTVTILAEQGLDWHSHHDMGDLPSMVEAGGRTIVDVPIQRYMNMNERKLMGRTGEQFRSCAEIVAFFKGQLDAMRGAALYEPLCFQFGAHANMSGLPAYAWGVQEMILYAKSFDDVWFVTTGELARYWREHSGG